MAESSIADGNYLIPVFTMSEFINFSSFFHYSIDYSTRGVVHESLIIIFFYWLDTTTNFPVPFIESTGSCVLSDWRTHACTATDSVGCRWDEALRFFLFRALDTQGLHCGNSRFASYTRVFRFCQADWQTKFSLQQTNSVADCELSDWLMYHHCLYILCDMPSLFLFFLVFLCVCVGGGLIQACVPGSIWAS